MNRSSKIVLTLCCIIVFYADLLSASQIHYKYVEYQNIIIRLAYQSNNSWNTILPLYKGIGYILNDRVSELKNEGRIKDKRFHIKLGNPFDQNEMVLDFSESDDSYYFQTYGALGLGELLKVIEYFSQESWSSYYYSYNQLDHGSVSEFSEKVNEKLTEILSKIDLTVTLDKYAQEEIVVEELFDLRYIYSNESLKYSIGSTQLPIIPNGHRPEFIGGFYYFIDDGFLFVYKGESLLSSLPIQYYDRALPGDYHFEREQSKVYIKCFNNTLLEFNLSNEKLSKYGI